MNMQARITGIDSTTRSIRNANTRRVSTPRNNSGYSQGSKGGRPLLVEPLLDMVSPFDCVAAQDMGMVKCGCNIRWVGKGALAPCPPFLIQIARNGHVTGCVRA